MKPIVSRIISIILIAVGAINGLVGIYLALAYGDSSAAIMMLAIGFMFIGTWNLLTDGK